jgi:uncharacterized protein YcbK (DUF882 family)
MAGVEECCRSTRRGFIASAVAATAALTLGPGRALAGAARPANRAAVRVLWLQRQGYDENVRAPFTVDGRTVYQTGYEELCWVLRDHQVDPRLGYVRFDVVTLEVAWEVQQILRSVGIDRPLIVHSGYRTQQTNAQTEGAARYSLHMGARAMDFHIPGVSIADVWRLCYSRALAGGIGYYPRGTGYNADQGWIHLDDGNRRYWLGYNGLQGVEPSTIGQPVERALT